MDLSGNNVFFFFVSFDPKFQLVFDCFGFHRFCSRKRLPSVFLNECSDFLLVNFLLTGPVWVCARLANLWLVSVYGSLLLFSFSTCKEDLTVITHAWIKGLLTLTFLDLFGIAPEGSASFYPRYPFCLESVLLLLYQSNPRLSWFCPGLILRMYETSGALDPYETSVNNQEYI